MVLPNLATLRIVVCEENGKLLGQRVLPVEGLRPGRDRVVTVFVMIDKGKVIPRQSALKTNGTEKISMNYYNIAIENLIILKLCVISRRKMHSLHEIRDYE